MNMFACTNCEMMLPDGNVAHGLTLTVANGKIASIERDAQLPQDIEVFDLGGHVLAPGFVDLQVNGGGGALFNDAPTVETIRKIASAHYQFGTTAFLPTLISDDFAKIEQAYAAVNAAIEEGIPGVVGIHIEGPFLNSRRKGIHDDGMIRQLDDAGMAVVATNRPDVTLMTLAPECVSTAQIEMLKSAGILMCAGHTEGTFSEICNSFEAGVIGVTHLFNAMSQLTVREPGAVGAALSSPDCWCCIIVDGAHVHPEALRLAIKAKGSLERFVLVTDAMPTVGQIDKQFMLNGAIIDVRDGVCKNSDGTLAGSDLDMATAVSNAASLLQISQREAIILASANPAKMLGLEDRFGSLECGLDANMVEIGADGAVLRTWVEGQLVWNS